MTSEYSIYVYNICIIVRLQSTFFKSGNIHVWLHPSLFLFSVSTLLCLLFFLCLYLYQPICLSIRLSLSINQSLSIPLYIHLFIFFIYLSPVICMTGISSSICVFVIRFVFPFVEDMPLVYQCFQSIFIVMHALYVLCI